MARDEFFIGYINQIPPGIKRFFIILISILVSSIILLSVIFPFVHNQFSTGSYTKSQEFEGLLLDKPIPQLLVPHPGNLANHDPYSRYILASTRKSAVSPKVLGLAGKWVKLTAIPVFRDNMTLLAVSSKIDPQVINPPSQPLPSPTTGKPLGIFTLTGEIVDSKCYLGVMKPGHSVTHRDCAIRCISGGIPPALRVINAAGDPLYLLLVDQKGKAINDRILHLVADPVTLTGEVMQYGDLFVLKVRE